MVVDIRAISGDFFITELNKASVVTKKWWGRRVDNYWEYLNENSEDLKVNLNAHVISDLFVYLADRLKFEAILEKYSAKLSKNRGTFVSVLLLEDKDKLIGAFSNHDFLNNFEAFAKELNGEFYNYDRQLLNGTIDDFKSIVDRLNNNFGLIVSIG